MELHIFCAPLFSRAILTENTVLLVTRAETKSASAFGAIH
jgi:hypothetical protein